MAALAKGRGRSGRRRAVAEINVVPYIDVMLVLLIIFMVTAPMLQQGIEIDVPKVASETIPSKKEPPVVLGVNGDGFYLNIFENPNVALTPEVIQARIAAYRKLHPDVPVLVRGEPSVAYSKVVEAMAMVKSAGVDKVGLVTESPVPPKASGK